MREYGSDCSRLDFTFSSEDDYDPSSDSRSSIEKKRSRKTAQRNEKKSRTDSNQSCTQNLQNLNLNSSSSFGRLPNFHDTIYRTQFGSQQASTATNLNKSDGNNTDTQPNENESPNAAHSNENDDNNTEQQQNDNDDQRDSVVDGNNGFDLSAIPHHLRRQVLEDEDLIRRPQQQAREADGAHLNKRLTAPPSEVRKRKGKKNNPNDEMVELLRDKQIELVHKQIELHDILIENAKIAHEERKEKLLLARLMRRSEELFMNPNNK